MNNEEMVKTSRGILLTAAGNSPRKYLGREGNAAIVSCKMGCVDREEAFFACCVSAFLSFYLYILLQWGCFGIEWLGGGGG
ncbi:hypothetical protein J7M07_03930 [bacterium]|nr:hypothetical protein [bacterium]